MSDSAVGYDVFSFMDAFVSTKKSEQEAPRTPKSQFLPILAATPNSVPSLDSVCSLPNSPCSDTFSEPFGDPNIDLPQEQEQSGYIPIVLPENDEIKTANRTNILERLSSSDTALNVPYFHPDVLSSVNMPESCSYKCSLEKFYDDNTHQVGPMDAMISMIPSSTPGLGNKVIVTIGAPLRNLKNAKAVYKLDENDFKHMSYSSKCLGDALKYSPDLVKANYGSLRLECDAFLYESENWNEVKVYLFENALVIANTVPFVVVAVLNLELGIKDITQYAQEPRIVLINPNNTKPDHPITLFSHNTATWYIIDEALRERQKEYPLDRVGFKRFQEMVQYTLDNNTILPSNSLNTTICIPVSVFCFKETLLTLRSHVEAMRPSELLSVVIYNDQGICHITEFEDREWWGWKELFNSKFALYLSQHNYAIDGMCLGELMNLVNTRGKRRNQIPSNLTIFYSSNLDMGHLPLLPNEWNMRLTVIGIGDRHSVGTAIRFKNFYQGNYVYLDSLNDLSTTLFTSHIRNRCGALYDVKVKFSVPNSFTDVSFNYASQMDTSEIKQVSENQYEWSAGNMIIDEYRSIILNFKGTLTQDTPAVNVCVEFTDRFENAFVPSGISLDIAPSKNPIPNWIHSVVALEQHIISAHTRLEKLLWFYIDQLDYSQAGLWQGDSNTRPLEHECFGNVFPALNGSSKSPNLSEALSHNTHLRRSLYNLVNGQDNLLKRISLGMNSLLDLVFRE